MGRWQFKRHFSRVIPVVGLILFVFGRPVHAVPNGGYSYPEALIQPEELKGLMDREVPYIRIIDVRENSQYLMGHIPEAVQLWRPDVEDQKHALPGMMAPREQIEELFGRLGISNKETLILYSDLYDHARLWWILAYYGFPLKQIKLLDGGIDGWKAKGYPTQMIPPVVRRVKFEFGEKTKRNTPLLCTLPEVKSALNDSKKAVLDVRSQKEYLGEEMKKGAQKAGRIPGVTWIEWKETIVGEGPYKGYWKSSEEIKKIFSAKGVTPDKDVYIY
jgi:thiosulfate/3-mercaptopyruvate sulfurtransferase